MQQRFPNQMPRYLTGEAEWRLQIHVKRVVRGTGRAGEVIPVKAISHAEIRNDRDFLIVLRPPRRRSLQSERRRYGE